MLPPGPTQSPADATRTIRNETAGLAELADWIGDWMQGAGIAGPGATKMRLVMEEIAANALMHGFPSDESGHVRVEVWDGPAEGPWWLRIADDGPAFDPLATTPEDISDVPVNDRGDGGAGLMLVYAVAESQHYERRDGWNMVTVKIGNSPIGG